MSCPCTILPTCIVCIGWPQNQTRCITVRTRWNYGAHKAFTTIPIYNLPHWPHPTLVPVSLQTSTFYTMVYAIIHKGMPRYTYTDHVERTMQWHTSTQITNWHLDSMHSYIKLSNSCALECTSSQTVINPMELHMRPHLTHPIKKTPPWRQQYCSDLHSSNWFTH